jgi:endonuclease-3
MFFRISNRIGIVNEKDVVKTEIALLKNIPEKWQQHAHHWLILHGRYICTAKKPKCNICPISQYCKYWKLLQNKIN